MKAFPTRTSCCTHTCLIAKCFSCPAFSRLAIPGRRSYRTTLAQRREGAGTCGCRRIWLRCEPKIGRPLRLTCLATCRCSAATESQSPLIIVKSPAAISAFVPRISERVVATHCVDLFDSVIVHRNCPKKVWLLQTHETYMKVTCRVFLRFRRTVLYCEALFLSTLSHFSPSVRKHGLA